MFVLMTLLSPMEEKKSFLELVSRTYVACWLMLICVFVHLFNKILIYSNLFEIYLAIYKGTGNLLQTICMLLVSTS